MSRTWTTNKRSDGWVMECDSCYSRTESRPTENDFPLIEFADLDWLISQRGDCCPECQAKGKTSADPAWDQERLLQDFSTTLEHCLKFYGRAPLSISVAKYADVKAKQS